MLFFFSILFTLRESGCSYEQQDTPISFVAKGSHVDGCCFAAAYGIRPWTPWTWGILSFRSIRVLDINDFSLDVFSHYRF